MMRERQPISIAELQTILAIFGSTFLALWALYGVPLQNLSWDPSLYYAHIRSPLIDGDLDFRNDGLPPSLVASHTRTGLAPSIWSAGPALVWAPFFLLAHAATMAGRAVGLPLLADGYGPFYLLFCALGSAFVGWLGILWCYMIARRISSAGPALLATTGVWLTSSLFYYMYKNPMMAHAPTVALIGALVYLWLRIADDLDTLPYWFLLGLLIGLAALMRWQNGLFAVIVPFALHTSRHEPRWGHGTIQRLSLAAGGALLGFLPQMVVWWRLYGNLLALPQGGGFLHWFRPEVYLLLLGSNRGLFVWQPLLLVGCVGLLIFARQQHRLGIALILVALLETYLNSIVADWWGGGGFGARRFDWFLPIAVLGSALVFEMLWARRSARAIMWVLLVGLCLFQLALAQAHYYRVLPEHQPFPIVDYDTGQPLARDFFAQAVFGSLRDPAFLIETTPTIWGDAIPPIHTWAEFLRGKPADVQALATSITAVLALGLILLASLVITAFHRSNTMKALAARSVWRISAVLLAWVLIASVIFGTTGP
ncbi:MAG: hypothetical protein ABIV47_04630 [Roseiflexaceae bacterium]